MRQASTPAAGTIDGMPPSSLSPIALLRSLRAVRRYADCPVPDDVLLSVLEVARWTGSAKNTRPWELVVVRDRARLAELATCGRTRGTWPGPPITPVRRSRGRAMLAKGYFACWSTRTATGPRLLRQPS